MLEFTLTVAALALSPSDTHDGTAEAPTVTYSEAIDCAGIGLAFGLILVDSDLPGSTPEKVERGKAMIAWVEPFMAYAREVGERSRDEVLDAIGASVEELAERLETHENMPAEINRLAVACEPKAAAIR